MVVIVLNLRMVMRREQYHRDADHSTVADIVTTVDRKLIAPLGPPRPMDKGHCKKDPPIQNRPAFGRFVLQLVDSSPALNRRAELAVHITFD